MGIVLLFSVLKKKYSVFTNTKEYFEIYKIKMRICDDLKY